MNILLYLTSSSYRKHRWARKKLVEMRRNLLWYQIAKVYSGFKWNHCGYRITIPKVSEITAEEL